MSNSVFHLELKFLFDENIDKRLERFLRQKKLDIMLAPKGFSNSKLAPISKSENRILVTNDSDFTDSFLFPKEKIFAVVWLRIPQDKPTTLLKAFSKLLKEKTKQEDFEGKLITLYEDRSETSRILSRSELKLSSNMSAIILA